jgi:type I restriction enzyme, S subunit
VRYSGYEAYKYIASWPGDRPQHWEVKKLAHLARLKSGENITSEELEEGASYPVYGGNGIRGYSSRFTNNGDFVLIGRQGALCGNVNCASGKFWASEHAIVVIPVLRF